jgi:2-amino-4-hydroxy-6-hydroxymethyldihydropteridine diphosphokinase
MEIRMSSQDPIPSLPSGGIPAGPVLIGLGANLPSRLGPPRTTLEAAMKMLGHRGARVRRLSRWYETAPVPASDQPWFQNAVAEIETDLGPEALLALLHEVEASLGRVRGVVNGPRAVDLDLLAYGGLCRSEAPVLPHPRLQDRAFVLLPLAEVAPAWHHPLLDLPVEELIRVLPPDQLARPVS